MSESFNLKNAKSLEAEYKSTWNFRGLADINIEFCEKIGSAHIYEDRLPRVFFYLGRLKGLEEIKLFIERNQSIFFWVDYEIQELCNKCFNYGYNYDNLSYDLSSEIKKYFLSDKYCELFLDMMFDIKYYLQDVEVFNFSLKKIRNTNFSNETIEQIAYVFINDNQEIDEVFCYNRAKNIVEEVSLDSDYEYELLDQIQFDIFSESRVYSTLVKILEVLKINDDAFICQIAKLITNEDYTDVETYNIHIFESEHILFVAEIIHNKYKDSENNVNRIQQLIALIMAVDYLNIANN
jgi:hypothetical protein